MVTRGIRSCSIALVLTITENLLARIANNGAGLPMKNLCNLARNPILKCMNQKRKAHVTVCIAAICNNGIIMGAADYTHDDGGGDVEI